MSGASLAIMAWIFLGLELGLKDALSMGDNFQRFNGSVSRAAKRFLCSSRVTENQYL